MVSRERKKRLLKRAEVRARKFERLVDRWKRAKRFRPTGPANPFVGARRVFLPLEGSDRQRVLSRVERLSFRLQGTVESHLRASEAERLLLSRKQYLIASRLGPCFDLARWPLQHYSYKRSRPTDCVIGESAACSYCQLEAQLQLFDWITTEKRFEGGVSLTVCPVRWRRQKGALKFDLAKAKREVREILDMCSARVHVFGRFEFSLYDAPHQQPVWEPHLHLIVSGLDAKKVCETLWTEFREAQNTPVFGKDIRELAAWASYLNKGTAVAKKPYVTSQGRPRNNKTALDKSSELELFKYLHKKTINDLLFRWGIDIPRHRMNTLTLKPKRISKKSTVAVHDDGSS